MGYRQDYIKAKPPVRGRYKCVSCKKKFFVKDITIDHKIPMRKGGTDAISNLQPMCRSCNSSKSDNLKTSELVGYMAHSAIKGDLIGTVGGMATQGVKDMLGIKYKRRH